MRNPCARRSRPLRSLAVAGAVALAGAGCGGGSGATATTTTTPPTQPTATTGTTGTTAPSPGPLGPERVPIPNGPVLAPVNSSAYPQTIDAIRCEVSEQLVYHIHAHLTVFIDGQARQVPGAIGIAPPVPITKTPVGDFASGGSCFYWLHTHAADGIIHIESPTQTLYTLGQFFDMWGTALSTSQVGPASGTVTAYVNGQPFSGNPRAISLSSRSEVQLDVGAVVAPEHIDWSVSGL